MDVWESLLLLLLESSSVFSLKSIRPHAIDL